MYNIKYTNNIPLLEGHFNMGEVNESGEEITVNSQYLIMNKEPWIPVMGEMQYSRIDNRFWEEEILKVKAGGVNIISTYVFWIHHEEIEGQMDFSGDRDLRKFIELCSKHDMFMFLRIGPWVHGEARNGGFPDWLLHKGYGLRQNEEGYLKEVRRYYNELEKQAHGFMFRENGNIIGIQLDNELTYNPEHIATLKEIAIEVGFSVPLYTVTGWGQMGGALIPPKEVLPVFGGYPEAPWETHTNELEVCPHFFFHHIRNDGEIGKDIIPVNIVVDNQYQINYDIYPFTTCELGGGICITHHRRPIISADDVASIALVKLGCGNNLPGYYMYHGGSNPLGKLSTFNESHASGYSNDVPVISYDFQTAIGEYGQIRKQYHLLKCMHLFLTDFGNLLAPMISCLPQDNVTDRYDTKELRYAARIKGSSGFIFVSNYQRLRQMAEHEKVKFNLQLEDEIVQFPIEGIDVKDGVYFILPFNLDLNGVKLKYSTTQLICKTKDTYFFFAPEGVKSEYLLNMDNIQSISGAQYAKINGDALISNLEPNTDCIIKITKKDGSIVNIITLTLEQANKLYKFGDKVFISDADMFYDGGAVTLYRLGNNDLSYFEYEEGTFQRRLLTVDEQNYDISYTQKNSESYDSKYSSELYLDNAKPVIEVEITLPSDVSNAFLKIKYIGDVAQIYEDGKLIADDFYTGEPWLVGIKLVVSSSLKLVFSELDGSNIYLETKNKSGLSLESIKLIREYRASIKL